MGWPGFTDYQDAFQHPRLVFGDEPLRGGTVALDSNDLPLPLSGAMAITFTVTGSDRKKYAIRCFQREMPDVESRYMLIDKAIKTRLSDSSYFVDFHFRRDGLNIAGGRYPYVQMKWVEGITLGSYLNANYLNAGAMDQLQQRFSAMAGYLGSKGVAHGDIQNLNVMVERNGNLCLIDYDGMFVPGMRSGDGTETGLRYFQHPDRAPEHFGPEIDRFSFIAVDLSLSAVKEDASLFPRFREGGETIIFKANDFTDPASSPIFSLLFQRPSLKDAASRFAAICKGKITAVPTLDDFRAGRNIPSGPVIQLGVAPAVKAVRQAYIAAYPVIDAASFPAASARFGQRVELVGQIKRVQPGMTRYKKPFVFLHFCEKGQDGVRIVFWSEALASMAEAPDTSWEGRWINCSGLLSDMYPRQRSKRSPHISVGIVIQTASQISRIDKDEAMYRLGRGDASQAASPGLTLSNAEKFKVLTEGRVPGSPRAKPPSASPPAPPRPTRSPPAPPLTDNQRRFQEMQARARSAQPATPPQTRASASTSQATHSIPPTESRGTFWLTRVPWWVWGIVALIVLSRLR